MQQTYFYYFKYFILGHVECGHKLQMGCWFWEVHVSFDQVLMKTRHATTSLRGRGGMPKATWSQSSERYYQQRLKLHFDQLADFSVWLCQWGHTRNLHSLANCIVTSQRYQMSCQRSHHMMTLDITFIQVSSFSSFPCMTIGSQQTWMDDGLDLGHICNGVPPLKKWCLSLSEDFILHTYLETYPSPLCTNLWTNPSLSQTCFVPPNLQARDPSSENCNE